MKKALRLMLGIIAGVCPALSQEGFAERSPRYKLQAGDAVEVQYRYTPEYNSTVSIQPDGFVELSLIGSIRLEGLTIDQTAAAIKDKASQRLNDPEVSVTLKDFVHPFFIVAGEVARPGRFDMRGNVTALEAIAMSGGFKESAKHSQVVLVQKFNSEYAKVTVLDFKRMMTAGMVREDVTLQPGDMLIVPQNRLSKVERYIRWSSVGLYGLSLLP